MLFEALAVMNAHVLQLASLAYIINANFMISLVNRTVIDNLKG